MKFAIKNLIIVLLGLSMELVPESCFSQIPVSVMTLPGGHKEDGFWVSLHAARSGKVYFGTCTHGGTGHFYEYDPQANIIKHIAASNEAVSENTPFLEPHGKIHCKIVEDKQGRIWWGTDMGFHYYMQKWDAPDGFPGGHMMVYDPKTGKLDDLGIPFPRAAIRLMAIDKEKDILYVGTFPDGRLYKYDIPTGSRQFLGRVNNCDAISRLIHLDDQGNVYGSFNPYGIFKYDVSTGKLSDLPVTIPHLEGPWCDKGHYHRENVWRDVTWNPTEKVFYGIEMGSGGFFRFNPANNAVDDLGQLVIPELEGERIVPESSHSLIWHDGLKKIFYSAPDPSQHKPDAKPRRLMSFDPATGTKKDHGEMRDPVSGAFPIYTEGVSVGPDGTIYYAGNVKAGGQSTERWEIGLVILKMSDIK